MPEIEKRRSTDSTKRLKGLDDPKKLAKIKKKLSNLGAEVAEGLTQNETGSSKRIKLEKAEVIAYDPKIFESAEEYYRYLSSNIKSPKDVVSTLKGFVSYYADPQDMLSPEDVVLAAGFGDCENHSWLAKCLLDDLGERKGINYNARVIGLRDHAICIYTDEAGENWSIDQTSREKFNSIYDVSAFSKKGDKAVPEEERLFNREVKEIIELDHDLAITYELVVYDFYNQNFDKSFDPNQSLPEDWSKYKHAQLNFKNNTTVFYQSGNLEEVEHEDGSSDFFYKGTDKIEQRKYPKGKVVVEMFDLEGRLYQRNFKDGTIESYDPESGDLFMRFFPNGNLEKEFYHMNGVARQKNHRAGKIDKEYFGEDGKILQRNFFEKGGHKYQTEWYDSSGAVAQTRTFKGETERK